MTHFDQPGGTGAAREPADVVAAAVRAVPGVADLHAGMFGEVGTYLPGRRVSGVRLGEADTDIHVSIVFGAPVRKRRRQFGAPSPRWCPARCTSASKTSYPPMPTAPAPPEVCRDGRRSALVTLGPR